jgi:hypothetical protein
VLQEQSQYPSFPDFQVQSEVFPYAERLVDSIYAHGWCTEPMFYMTWGRKNGDQQNAQFFPPLATYEGMDSLLYERYMQMGADNDASVCPVGRVWRFLRTHHREIELYQADGSHPSVAGSYAAACAFYTMLFHGDPDSISFDAGLPRDVAEIIRGAVRTVVYDSLPTWKRLLPDLQIVAVDTLQYMTCSFGIDFINCDTVLCFWGDGSEEVLTPNLAINHTYFDTGDYVITLTATRHCMNTVVEHHFHAVAEPEVGIPAINRVCAGVEHDLILYSLDGRELRRRRADRMPLDGLLRGIYLLAVDGVVYRIYKN